MRSLPIFAMLVALSSLNSAYAAGQSRTDAQAAGSAVGSSALTTGRLTPAASNQTATTPGAGNVWGSSYTGTADPTLTGKQGSSSLIGIGNAARTDASQKFNGYNSTRSDQASQATYFLDKNPILKPTLHANDPMFRTDNLAPPDIFASSSTKICKQQTITAKYDNTELYTCAETYNPYIVSCSDNVNITVGRETTCNVGQQYSVSMGDSTGMGGDNCQGGDAMSATWTCSTDDNPSISMSTNSSPWGTVSGVVPANGSVIVSVDGSCQAKFVNSTSCLNGQCTGSYTMILGTNDPIYGPYPSDCTPSTVSDEGGNITVYKYPDGSLCSLPILGYTFQERSFGAASRITANGSFSMSKTTFASSTTSTCAALEGLSQP